MGLRLIEINALKYFSIDYVDRRLFAATQLDVDLKKDKSDCKKKTITKQEVELKIKNSKRWLNILDLPFKVTLYQKQIYEKNRKGIINDKNDLFIDDGYICYS